MVKAIMRHIVVCLSMLLSGNLYAQGVFSTVTVNKSEVYLGEAIEMTVSVYTPTWFTRGVDIGNIQINGAFSVYFRSVSTSRKINGQTYAGVQLIYNLFPYEQADVVIPALSFEVETPNVGGYKGINRKVSTKEKVVRLKPIPPDVDRDRWMVTTSFRVREKWSGSLTSVKVGDVLERTISRNAANTVGELLPPLVEDSIAGVSQYPERPEVKTNKTKTTISASRTDAIRYLFEEEGAVVIPAVEFIWWNPWQKKFLKRTLPERTINVATNPDLGIVKSIKASLEAETLQAQVDEVEPVPPTFLGLGWKQWLLILVAAFLLGYILNRALRRLIAALKEKRAAYKETEAYAFSRFMKATRKGNGYKALDALYVWLSALLPENPTMRELAAQVEDKDVIEEIQRIEAAIAGAESRVIPVELNVWKRARKAYLSKKKDQPKDQMWINPE